MGSSPFISLCPLHNPLYDGTFFLSSLLVQVFFKMEQVVFSFKGLSKGYIKLNTGNTELVNNKTKYRSLGTHTSVKTFEG